MKKIMFAAALMVASLSASAQVYIGGGVALHSTTPETVKDKDVDDITTFKLLPELGYKIDDNLSIGAAFGYSYKKQGDVKNTGFSIEPYIRYTFAKWNNVGFFGEGGFGYEHTNNSTEKEVGKVTVKTEDKVNTWYIGVRPGISVDLSKNFTLVSKIGWLGYKSWKHDNDDAKAGSDFGLDLDASNIQFSLLYNF